MILRSSKNFQMSQDSDIGRKFVTLTDTNRLSIALHFRLHELPWLLPCLSVVNVNPSFSLFRGYKTSFTFFFMSHHDETMYTIQKDD